MGEEVRRDLNVIAFEFEKSLLGSILFDPKLIASVASVVQPEDFGYPLHAKIYRYCLAAQSKGIDVDFFSAYEATPEVKFDFFVGLKDHALPGSVSYLARTIKEQATRREAHQIMTDSIESVFTPGVDINAQTVGLSESLLALARPESGFKTTSDQAILSSKKLEDTESTEIFPTGLIELDGVVGGLRRGELWVIAGRTSMGKSALCANLARNLAVKKKGVAFISVEGSNHSLYLRLVSIGSGIPVQALRNNQLTTKQTACCIEEFNYLGDLPIYLFDGENRWEKIQAQLTNLRLHKPDLSVAVIDYVGLISCKGKNTRREELETLSREAKGLATKLGIALILVAQLNRQPENRPDHRPRLSDLRETGALEQDADLVILLYRSHYYDSMKNERDLEIGVLKNREGPTGTVYADFEAATLRIENTSENGVAP
jgi:replicative DNA helicase|tara:strand:+ start:9570 stop:10862 length:1293 start_codon:yes stop_codon:yes gene_type:complete